MGYFPADSGMSGYGDIEVGIERKVGTFTINGVTYDRYLKVIDIGTLPNNQTKRMAHDISNYVGFISVRGIGYGTTNNIFYNFPLPRTFMISSVLHICDIFIEGANIALNCPDFDLSSYKGYAFLEYYK